MSTRTDPCARRPWSSYAARRLLVIFISGGVKCRVRRCAESTVGFSSWCREHTDQILEHRESTALLAALDELRVGA